MATWSATAKSAWTAGMRSATANTLDSSGQIALKGHVERWADTLGAGGPVTKLFLTSKTEEKLAVKVSCQGAQITGNEFGKTSDLMR